MPVVCSFDGINVILHSNDHNPPHFHARYGKRVVLIEIRTLQIYRGSLPGPQLRKVQQWAADRQEGLMRNWNLARQGKPVERLAPPSK